MCQRFYDDGPRGSLPPSVHRGMPKTGGFDGTEGVEARPLSTSCAGKQYCRRPKSILSFLRSMRLTCTLFVAVGDVAGRGTIPSLYRSSLLSSGHIPVNGRKRSREEVPRSVLRAVPARLPRRRSSSRMRTPEVRGKGDLRTGQLCVAGGAGAEVRDYPAFGSARSTPKRRPSPSARRWRSFVSPVRSRARVGDVFRADGAGVSTTRGRWSPWNFVNGQDRSRSPFTGGLGLG